MYLKKLINIMIILSNFKINETEKFLNNSKN